jgi:haloalkane dehalogenase
VKRLFLMNTLFGYGGATPPEEKTPWFQWIEKHEEAGTLGGIVGELGSTALSVMKIVGFQNTAAVTDTWIRAYSAPFPDRDSCIGAIEFPLDVHYARFQEFVIDGLQTGNLDRVKAVPASLVYGMEDRAIAPEWAMADFRLLFPDAPVVQLPGVGHFCQEDAPETLVAMIQQFIQANP